MSVNVFNSKVLIEDTSLLYVSFWRRDRLFTLSWKPLEGLAVCRTREVPSFLSYFKRVLLVRPRKWDPSGRPHVLQLSPLLTKVSCRA